MRKRILSVLLIMMVIFTTIMKQQIFVTAQSTVMEKKKIDTFYEHTAVIDENGDLYVWGNNKWGQVGDGTQTNRRNPVFIMSDVESVSVGYSHTLALKTDGTLWAWGSNLYGELGNSIKLGYCTAEPFELMDNVIDMFAGYEQSYIITSDNILYAMGLNSTGQLGDNTTTNRNTPVKILDDVVSVSASMFRSHAAIKKDGSLWTWGSGLYHDDEFPMIPTKKMDDVRYVATGRGSMLAIKNDDTLWAMGMNEEGALCSGNDEWIDDVPEKVMEDVKDVSTSGSHTFVVKNSGELFVCGSTDYGQLGIGNLSESIVLTPTKIMDNILSVDLGKNTSFVCTEDGNVFACGINSDGIIETGYLGDGSTINRESLVYIMSLFENMSEIDKYIIEQVSKYTSDDMMLVMDKVLSSNYSDDIKFQVLNEMFQNYGLTDAEEGIHYLSETSAHRMNYRYLTTDDIFCAYNFGNMLANNLAARSALYTQGLIFNYEVFKWLDLSTYIESDYPGVKKNKQMLIDFMGQNDKEIEALTYAKKTGEFLENMLKISDIETTSSMEELMDDIINCTSEEKLKNLQEQFANYIIASVGGNKLLYFKSENFKKALGDASGVVSFVADSVNGIVTLINMENQMDLYEQYSYFLTSIFENKDVSGEMRMAAEQLYDEIENGYYKQIQSMLLDCYDKSKKTLKITTLCDLIDNATGGALELLKLATFISNIIIDVGDFSRQAAYTQGYAELSTLFRMKLQEDAERFKSNKTAANAWKFFDDYNLLWSLRYNGEKQFLEMNSIKTFVFAELKSYNYSAKKDMVDYTLNQLNKSKFEFTEYDIPKSIQYTSKSVINSPVNVYVYTQSGELVAKLLDGIESDITNKYGRFAVVYKPYTGEYAKVICQKTDEKLIIKTEATIDCVVNFETAAVNKTNTYTFDGVNITKGSIIETKDNLTYTIFNNENDKIGTQYSASFVINFNSNCNYIDNFSKKYFFSDDYIELPLLERPGYIFEGWHLDSNCTMKVIEDNVNGNQVLYAKWTPIFNYEIKNNEIIIKDFLAPTDKDGFPLSDIVVPAFIDGYKVTEIGERAFASRYIGTIELPDTLKKIGTEAFLAISDSPWNDSPLVIEIPSSVEYIGDRAFQFVSCINKVVFSEGLQRIGDMAFFGASINEAEIIIPASVVSVGLGALDAFGKIEVNEENQFYSSVNNALFNKNQTELYKIPFNQEGEYIVPETVTYIGRYAISPVLDCNLTTLVIPKTVCNIDEDAFNNLTNNYMENIYYLGSQEDWKFLYRGSLGEYPVKTNVYYDCKYYDDSLKICYDGSKTTFYGDFGEECVGRTIVFALYDCGVLSDVKLVDNYSEENIELSSDKKHDEIKVMIWEDSMSVKPSTNVQEICTVKWD